MLRNALIALVILMVAGGQVVGMQRGYVCDHGAVLRDTRNEHCHEDKSAEDSQQAACASDVSESCDTRGDKQRHAPLNESFQAPSPGSVGVSVPNFISILLAEIPDFSAMIRSALMEAKTRHFSPAHAKAHHRPATDAQVALCTVMLI